MERIEISNIYCGVISNTKLPEINRALRSFLPLSPVHTSFDMHLVQRSLGESKGNYYYDLYYLEDHSIVMLEFFGAWDGNSPTEQFQRAVDEKEDSTYRKIRVIHNCSPESEFRRKLEFILSGYPIEKPKQATLVEVKETSDVVQAQKDL